MPNHTIFHKILAKEIPATVVYEDDDVLAFLDIHPKAPTHVLFIPKNAEIESVQHLSHETAEVPGQILLAIRKFALEQGIDGYRLQINVGKAGGQEVPYLHVHFLSEQKLKD